MAFLDHIFSFPCIACNKKYDNLFNSSFLCDDCLKQLFLNKGLLCPGCGGPLDGILKVCPSCLKEDERPWVKAYSLFQMKGYGQKLIHNYKYNGQAELARPLGRMATEMLKSDNVKYDFIVPIPLHWARYLKRGYNQATLLSLEISKHTGIPIKNMLKRKKWTQQQAKLNRDERQKNIKDVFSIKKEVKYKKSTILLVDDVLTTGSTLTSATKELLKAGVEDVYILILARGY